MSGITRKNMPRTKPSKPRLFVDADVLFAGAASPSEHSASLLILRLAEITLIEALTSEQVITEAERNLSAKIPKAIPVFNHLVSRCLTIVPDPEALSPYDGLADPKDLPILAAAVSEGCSWLVTFNLRHFQPGHTDLTVLTPGEFILRIRDLLTQIM
ncbi:MAG: PIN domain-containing protein [Anaerolineales bacterium]|nr:PIN domain-containing protein [Anaerolineales bacterium]